MIKGKGFTLVELLVVIAVIGVLAGLLLPVLSTARKNAAKSKCGSNLEQMKRYLDSYAAGNDGKFPLASGWQSLISEGTAEGAAIFECPSAERDATVDYSGNQNVMSGANEDSYLSQVDNSVSTVFACDGIASTVSISDTAGDLTTAEQTALGTARTRHLGGANYITVGGGVKFFTPEDGNANSNLHSAGLKWGKFDYN